MREKGTSTPVLGLEPPPKGTVEARRPAIATSSSHALAAFRVTGVIGAVIALVGFTDLAFAWFPFEWGNLEWEFGTSSRTFDGLPLVTIGIGALAASAIGLGSRRGVLATFLLVLLTWLLVVGSLAIYWLNVPPAWAAAPAPILASLKIAALRSSIFMIVYLGSYSWLILFLWRRWRSFP